MKAITHVLNELQNSSTEGRVTQLEIMAAREEAKAYVEARNSLLWLLTFVGQGTLQDFSEWVHRRQPDRNLSYEELRGLIDKCLAQCNTAISRTAIPESGSDAVERRPPA